MHCIVPDDMTAVVVRADSKAPVLSRAFVEYAQARDFFVEPARVRRPRDKARVENQIPFRFFSRSRSGRSTYRGRFQA